MLLYSAMSNMAINWSNMTVKTIIIVSNKCVFEISINNPEKCITV